MGYYEESHLRRLRLINKMKIDEKLPMMVIKQRLKELERTGNWESSLPSNGDIKNEMEYYGGRRREIINAAIRVFSEKGYRNTKVQDITQEAGISTGTFYIYFSNKRDLFIGVVDSIFRTLVGEASKAIGNEHNPIERLEIRGQIFFKHYSKYNEILHQLRAEMAGDDAWPAERIKQAYRELTEPVVNDINDMIKQGISRPINAELLAYAMTGITEIMSMRAKMDDTYTFSEIQEFMRDMFLNGVRPR